MDYRIAKDKIAGQVMFLLTIASIFLVIIMAVGLFIKSEPILSQYNLWDSSQRATGDRWKASSDSCPSSPAPSGVRHSPSSSPSPSPCSWPSISRNTPTAASGNTYIPCSISLPDFPPSSMAYGAPCSSCLGFRSMLLPSSWSFLRDIRFWRAASY